MERYDLSVADIQGDFSTRVVSSKGICLAIGFFDGVHLGHLEVARKAVSLARQQGLTPAIMTFDPHPRVVLGHGAQYETVLTPLEDKLALLAEVGIEAAYVVHFNKELSLVTAEQFVKKLLRPLGATTVVVGFDFSFGHRGEGNAESIGMYANGEIEVHIVSPVYLNQDKVSSTRIRDLLAEGDCSHVIQLLDRPYEVKGTVVHGHARGRLLGFPTANISPSQPYVIPRSGVYAIRATTYSESGEPLQSYNGVINVGIRPTFTDSGNEVKLEAHLFDYEGDLYGHVLSVAYWHFLRPEKKFESIEQLIDQITVDATEARKLLAELPHL